MSFPKKRKASFVGTAEWVKKDVKIEHHDAFTRVTDMPTVISVSSAFLSEEALLGALAHRVKQLS